jgi:hypothetical protein
LTDYEGNGQGAEDDKHQHRSQRDPNCSAVHDKRGAEASLENGRRQ